MSTASLAVLANSGTARQRPPNSHVTDRDCPLRRGILQDSRPPLQEVESSGAVARCASSSPPPPWLSSVSLGLCTSQALHCGARLQPRPRRCSPAHGATMSASAAHAAFERLQRRDQPRLTARVKETRACALGNPLMWSPFEPRRLVVCVCVWWWWWYESLRAQRVYPGRDKMHLIKKPAESERNT